MQLDKHANTPVVYCTDVPNLIERVKLARKFEEGDEILIKVGIDGGGGFLKITLSILSLNHAQSPDSFKESGVKRLLILALVPDLPEKYEYILLIWKNLLKMTSLKCVIAGDLKIINVLIGIMAHSSLHPCPYCEVSKKELTSRCGILRTIGNIKTNSSRDIKKSMKRGENACCIHDPLVHGKDDDRILDICPPPPLHINLGIVNAVFQAVEKKCPDWADLWVHKAQVRHQQRAYGFTGRACHSLMRSAAILQENVELKSYFHVSNISEYFKFSGRLMHNFFL